MQMNAILPRYWGLQAGPQIPFETDFPQNDPAAWSIEAWESKSK
jgi:hypothetical protein